MNHAPKEEQDTQQDARPNGQVRLESVTMRLVVVMVALSLTAVQPVFAQNAVCEATGLPGMISGFFQLTTGIGLIGVVVVWQANALSEMFTLDRDQRELLKRYRRRALKSAVVLVILGPLYSVAGTMMGLPLASCVDLTPL
jgi:hypothetical protein